MDEMTKERIAAIRERTRSLNGWAFVAVADVDFLLAELDAARADGERLDFVQGLLAEGLNVIFSPSRERALRTRDALMARGSGVHSDNEMQDSPDIRARIDAAMSAERQAGAA